MTLLKETKMKLINTHSHVYTEKFNADRKEVIERAVQTGVTKILLPDIDIENRTDVFALANKYPEVCFPMAGIHPTSVKENYKEELTALEECLKNNKVCALGEMGIDLYWDKTFLQEQIIVFKRQVELANQYNLPLVIHVRDAFDEVFSVLQEIGQKNYKGVFHCFTGNVEQANTAIAFGFKLGVGGVLTYKKSGLDKVFAEVSLEHLVLETDDPWLSPSPHRGKRNEPSYLIHIAEKLAEVKECSLEEIAEITTQNAINLFNL